MRLYILIQQRVFSSATFGKHDLFRPLNALRNAESFPRTKIKSLCAFYLFLQIVVGNSVDTID